MPLEQIGGPLQLLGGGGRRTDGSRGRQDSLPPSSVDASPRRRGGISLPSYDDGGPESWMSSTPLLNSDDPPAEPSSSDYQSLLFSRHPQNEDMTLLKLGGVGGVQRSGSWGYGRKESRTAFQNSLSESPEVAAKGEPVSEGQDEEATDSKPAIEEAGILASPLMKGERHPSPRIPWNHRAEQKSSVQPSTGSLSDVPSSSSRTPTSTSSSSAAAFSLRSLSDRNSASSTASSSASSSLRQMASDEDEGTASAGQSTAADSEDADSVATKYIGQGEAGDANESTSSLLTQTEYGYNRHTSSEQPAGFKVQRIQSIGRGYDVRRRAVMRASLGREGRDEEAQAPDESETGPRRTPQADRIMTPPPAQMHGGEDDRSFTSANADDTIVSLTRSPRKQTQRLGSGEQRVPASPGLHATPSGLKSRIDALTLTAAAQSSPGDAAQDVPKFAPPEPRRHTGSFALRSRSALSQTLGSSTMNFGNGQGRAAARKELAQRKLSTSNAAALAKAATSSEKGQLSSSSTASTLDGYMGTPPNSAPAVAVNDTPRASIVQIEHAQASRGDVLNWQASADALASLSDDVGVSPSTKPLKLSMPALAALQVRSRPSDDNLIPAPLHHHRNSDSALSAIARASPDASAFGLAPGYSPLPSARNDASSPHLAPIGLPSMHGRPSSVVPSSPLPGDVNAYSNAYSSDSLSASGSVLGVSPGRSSAAEWSSSSGNSGLGISRPAVSRSSTSLAGVNVLRTPTTEEWSRYLVKQGLDPSLIATAAGLSSTGKVHGVSVRSRTSTGRSATGGKRRISERDLFLQAAKASSSDLPFDPDMMAEAIERQGLSSTEVIEAARDSIRQSRPSLSSSVRGADDLGSVHEEDYSDDDDEHDDDGAADFTEQMGDDAEDDQRLHRLQSEERLSGGSDEDSGDGMDERMRALHEAISRPPSRRGTPAPSETGQDKMFSSTAEALRAQIEAARRGGLRWPSRDTAAALTGYPLPPTGEQRSIDDFAIVEDIGRGAYGLVKKARVRDEVTGVGAGPEFCIKYIIKSRILADCWRRHKVLGPIPVEIHVLDQLRRLPYQIPSDLPAWSPEKLFDSSPLVEATATFRSEDDYADGEDPTITVGHPSLCMMVDFFEDHEFYYMVMPCFGTGQDLFDYVESQPHGLTTRQVRCIFGQLADGLRFLHLNNVVHRDVKDENVILDGKGHIQLIDFGSAAHINTRSCSLLFDTFSGTLDYAAAEILRGEKYGGKEQDVWALGVVGYVLLCGDCPFWNGEEAMEGLHESTRAYTALVDRCRALHANPAANESDLHNSSPVTITSHNPVTFGLDGFTGLPIEHDVHEPRPADEADVGRRQSDIDGQPDAGGRLEDAADLILRCLELDLTARPTMDEICRHRFLIGSQGWSGHQGWQAHSSTVEV